MGIIPLTAQINDTDLDGIPNASDPAPTVNAVVSDPDGNNNLPASFQTGLIGRWDFQTLAISGANHRFADLAGGDQPLDCRQLSMSIDPNGMISKAALFDGANDHLAAPGSLFHNRSGFSTTLWFKMTPGSVEERFGSTTFLACNGALDSYPELIISITRAGRGPGQTISVSRFSGATQTQSFNGRTQTGDFLDDGYWHHLAYVKNGNNQRLFLNGVKIAESSLTSANFTATTAGYICYGKNIPNATDQGHTFRGSMDRIRFYSRNLSDAEISQLYLQDSDRDGFSDIVEKDWAATYPSLSPFYWQSPDADTDGDTIPDNWEHTNGLDPTNPNDAYDDPDYDGIQNQYEFLLGFHPNNPSTNGTPDITKDRDGDGLKDWQEAATGTFQWNIQLQKYIFIKVLDWEVSDANNDFDQDGLTNALELINATDLTNWDSDGDLLPDGWEVQHGLNPLNNSGVTGATGDFDGDGLSNLDELMYGSKPNTIDSDGDGTNDQQEAQQGSNPNNNSDQGQAPPPETTVEVPFRIGDPSGSHSERWKLTIQGNGPDDNRKIEFVSPDFGEMGEKTFKLRKSNKYTITVTHVATNEEESPDYDWEAQVDGKPFSESTEETPIQPGTNNFFVVKEHWLVDNREAVLTTEKHGDDENIVAGKKATLLPIEVLTPVLDTDGNEIDGQFINANELKVAKWENAFEGGNNDGSVKADFIDWDKDRFYVRILGGSGIGIEAVKIATEDCIDTDYNDDPTLVPLATDAPDMRSASMIIVSDDEDDDYADNGAGADDEEGDRTHKIQLGGNFVIKFILIDKVEYPLDLKLPVPIRKILPVDFIRMDVAKVHDLCEIKRSAKITNERYAQVGIKVNVNIINKEWLSLNPDRGEGTLHLFSGDRIVGGYRVGPMTDEYKSFINQTDRSGINVYFLNYCYNSSGIALTPAQIKYESGEIDNNYFDKAFVNFASGRLAGDIPAHELGHILAYKTDDDDLDDHNEPYFNLMNATPRGNVGVLSRKRFNESQQSRMYQHSMLNEPQ